MKEMQQKGVKMKPRTNFTATICILALLLLVIPAYATKSFEPVFNPNLKISPSSGEIKVDGALDDIGWQKVGQVANFVERHPGDNVEPLVDTRTLVTYDEDHLYVAFVCLDDPASIRATMCQRDQFFSDDAVIVLLDTYGDASWAYEFFVNPYGVQKDQLWTNIVGEDIGYDLVWESAAKITDSGYQVEIAIPFASLRFPNQNIQNWRMDFWRNHPRESFHQYSWAAYDRNERCWPCQWGTVDGISNVQPGHGLELISSVLANQAGALDLRDSTSLPFNNRDIDGDISMGGKYSVNSDITVEATYNPDFSQVESDAGQVDVNTTIALFFPERRPFFQEGRDIFRTLFNSFYTRMINDPQFALKATGRSGKYRFGMVSAVDEHSPYIIPLEERSLTLLNDNGGSLVGKSYVNVFRAMRTIGNNSQVGLIVNDRRYEIGGSNTVIGLDQNIRLSNNYAIDGQYLMTINREPDKMSLTPGLDGLTLPDGEHNAGFDGESYVGYGFISRFLRGGRHWSFFLDYNQVDKSYHTETGYDPWIDYRNLTLNTSYTFYPKTTIFERITPGFFTTARWNFEGIRKWNRNQIRLNHNLRFAQTFFSIAYGFGSEFWFGKEYDNLYVTEGSVNMRPAEFISFNLHLSHHRNVALNVGDKDDEWNINAYVNFKPIDRLVIEPSINYLTGNHYKTDEKLFENYVIRTRFRFQATRALSLRLVAQYTYREMLSPYINDNDELAFANNIRKSWNIEPLVTYQINPFTIFYIGMTGSFSDLGQSGYDYYFNPEVFSPAKAELDRDWELGNRQFFMKLQYLFQT